MKIKKLSRFPRTIAAFLLVLCAAVFAEAQTLNGSLSDGAQGPLLSGVVYQVIGQVNVPSGSTLTIQPGAILKFSNTVQFTINGTLIANGTSLQPIIFTDIRDDAFGGDTNLNGPSTGGSNWWRGLFFSSTATGCSVTNARVRYAGEASQPGIGIQSSSVTVNTVTVEFCSNQGMTFYNLAVNPTVTNCAFNGNNRAVDGILINSIPSFQNCTGSGNAAFDVINCSSATVSGNLTINASNLPGSVLYLTNHLAVPVSASLTLNAGVVIKTSNTIQFTIDGTLFVNGTTGSEVVVTDFRDDAIAGDTNKNGSSTGSPNWWRGIVFTASSDASVLNRLRLRYGGEASFGAIEIVDSNLSMSNSTIEFCSNAAIDLNNTASTPSISNCTFTGNFYAVDKARLVSVPGFHNCTSSGHAALDVINIVNGTLTQNLTIDPTDLPGGALYIGNHVSVGAGVQLTLNAGVVLKMANTIQWTIDGTLTALGQTVAPVIFTDIRDDAIAGDTNRNGPSSGGPNWWRGILFNSTADASSLTGVVIRYAGEASFAAIEIVNADIAMYQCLIDQCSGSAIDLNNTPSHPTIVDVVMTNNFAAVEGVQLGSVSSFFNCSAFGNAVSNNVNVVSATITGNATITKDNMVGGVVRVSNHVSIPNGESLTVGPGVVFKMSNTIVWTIDGTLNVNGTAGEPVVFTDIRDDAFGGDSNNNGPSIGSANWWRGIVFNAGAGGSVLENIRVRYAGEASYSGIEIFGADITIRDFIVENCSNSAVDLNNVVAQPALERGTLQNCGGSAITGLSWPTMVNMRHLTASGCTGGTSSVVTSSFVGGGALVRDWNAVNGVIHCFAHPSIGAGQSLRLESGLIVKMGNTIQWSVNGQLDIAGTGDRPVVFTDVRDDAFGGDTNQNGASGGTPNWWRGITYQSVASPSRVEHLLLRYAGEASFTGFASQSSSLTMESVRVERCSNSGFALTALANQPSNLVAFLCGGHGIIMNGGAFTLRHATSVANGNTGIVKISPSTGQVTSSIAWANSVAGFGGFAASDVVFSDGFVLGAGMNGNLNVDPMFEGQGAGDLRLAAGSPCVNVADQSIAFTVLTDHVEASRALDGNLSGLPPLSDMGAYERAPYVLSANGRAQTGTPIDYTVNGAVPGIAVFFAGLLDGAQQPLCTGLPCYGYLTVGFTSTIFLFGVQPTGVPQSVTVPALPFLEGYTFGVQAVAVTVANTTIGGFTNRLRETVFN